MMTYTKPNGKKVTVRAVPHAYERFRERWQVLRSKPLASQDIAPEFENCFKRARLVKHLTKEDKRRMRKRKGMGKTLYFRCDGFTFVVSDAKIWTVEISDKGKRHLN